MAKDKDTDSQGMPDGPVDTENVKLVLKEARDLAKALEGTATSRLSVFMGGMRIEIERGGGGGGAMAPMMASAAPAAGGAAAPSAAPGTMPVVAPVVGVFYRP